MLTDPVLVSTLDTSWTPKSLGYVLNEWGIMV